MQHSTTTASAPYTLADGLMVRHVDEQLVVIDKPSGMLSQPGRQIDGSVHTRLRDAFPAAEGPMLVHRLDMDTSGLMVFALTREAHRHLHHQFERREIHKRYTALLAGNAPGLGGRVMLPLRLDPDDRPRQVVCLRNGKAALTTWRRAGEAQRVCFYPHTGRTHQLRVHAAAGLAVPILGDPLYGQAADRLMLHADYLALLHPADGRRLTIRSPAPF